MFGCGRFPTMIILAVVGVVAFVILALALGGSPYYGYSGYYGTMMGGLGGFGMLIWIPIALVVVAVLGYVLWRGGSGWGMGGGGGCCGNGHQGHYANYGGRADAVKFFGNAMPEEKSPVSSTSR
jgi:hypothetical protein